MTTDSIISKVWSFCHTLRGDGVGYGDCLEQLTHLISAPWRQASASDGRVRRSASGPHSIRPSSNSIRSTTLMICSTRSAQPMLVSASLRNSRPLGVMPFCT